IHPDTLHHLHRSLVGTSFVAGLRRRRSLPTKLPSFVDELVHCFFCLEHKDCAELLYSHPEARLDLEHLHVRNFLCAVVEGDTLPLTPTGQQNLHAEIAEGGVSASGFDGGLSGRPRLVELCQRLARTLTHIDLLLLLRLCERWSSHHKDHGKHH